MNYYEIYGQTREIRADELLNNNPPVTVLNRNMPLEDLLPGIEGILEREYVERDFQIVNDGRAAHVRSQKYGEEGGADEVYVVQLDVNQEEALSCTCRDFTIRGHPHCKHMIAVERYLAGEGPPLPIIVGPGPGPPEEPEPPEPGWLGPVVQFRFVRDDFVHELIYNVYAPEPIPDGGAPADDNVMFHEAASQFHTILDERLEDEMQLPILGNLRYLDDGELINPNYLLDTSNVTLGDYVRELPDPLEDGDARIFRVDVMEGQAGPRPTHRVRFRLHPRESGFTFTKVFWTFAPDEVPGGPNSGVESDDARTFRELQEEFEDALVAALTLANEPAVEGDLRYLEAGESVDPNETLGEVINSIEDAFEDGDEVIDVMEEQGGPENVEEEEEQEEEEQEEEEQEEEEEEDEEEEQQEEDDDDEIERLLSRRLKKLGMSDGWKEAEGRREQRSKLRVKR